MNDKTEERVYRPHWRCDLWLDIEAFYPKGGTKISARLTRIERDFAFLTTSCGVSCFLDKRNVRTRNKISDLTKIFEEDNISVECEVLDYNLEKKRLVVAIDID